MLVVAFQVPSDHQDIKSQNYLFFCRNCPQSEVTEKSREEERIATNTNRGRRKGEDSKDPGPDKTQSSSQLLTVSTTEISGQNMNTEGKKNKETSFNSAVAKPQQVWQSQKENMREDGSPRKKSRKEEDDTGKSEGGQRAVQRIATSDASPELRTVAGPVTSQIPAQRPKEVSNQIWILDLLEHISRCQEAECGLVGCCRLKKIVSHTFHCRRPHCHVCRPMTDVLCLHARFCKVRRGWWDS